MFLDGSGEPRADGNADADADGGSSNESGNSSGAAGEVDADADHDHEVHVELERDVGQLMATKLVVVNEEEYVRGAGRTLSGGCLFSSGGDGVG